MYEYNAEIASVYDGDTCTATIDLGFGIHIRKAKLRLLGVNTPEIRGVEPEIRQQGLAARDWLRTEILGKRVRVLSKKKGKYGRYLVVIWKLQDGEPEPESLNDALIRTGHATPYPS